MPVTVEAVLKGGHADGRIITAPLPLPFTIMTARTPALDPWMNDTRVTYVPENATAYDFTGTAKITSAGEILMAIYRARGT